MADETDFLNDALGQIGAMKITAIDDESTNANYCKQFWPPLRRAMIRSHHWNFATDRAELSQNVGPPPFEFAYAYQLPADWLKVVTYSGVTVTATIAPEFARYQFRQRYIIEGRRLLSNDNPVLIVFLKDVTNPDIWDPLFYQAAASWLASKLAAAIQKSEKMASLKLEEAMKVFLPLAMSVDGQEGTELPEVIDDLLRVR